MSPAAGQWKYASRQLRTIWAKQHSHTASSRQLVTQLPGIAGGSLNNSTPQQSPPSPGQDASGAAGNAAGSAAAAAIVDSDTPPLDPATGKPVMLKTAAQFAQTFWQDSASGRELLKEVMNGAGGRCMA